MQYFTSRTNGTCVPLIPADELPFNVRFAGVPRVLSFDQTAEMQHAGSSLYTGRVLELESGMRSLMQQEPRQLALNMHPRSQSQSQSQTGTPFVAPDTLVRQAVGATALARHASLPPKSAPPYDPQWRRTEHGITNDPQVRACI